MALIKCPECGNSISDKAEKCPHCGIPASYFHEEKATSNDEIDYYNIGNVLISFDNDYSSLHKENTPDDFEKSSDEFFWNMCLADAKSASL